MTESKFWQTLKKSLPGHWQRIETMTGGGVPDVNGCVQGQEIWLELKILVGKTYPRWQSSQGVTPLQHAWLTNRARVGGLGFVVGYWVDRKMVLVWRGDDPKVLEKDPLGTVYATMKMPLDGPGLVAALVKGRPSAGPEGA